MSVEFTKFVLLGVLMGTILAMNIESEVRPEHAAGYPGVTFNDQGEPTFPWIHPKVREWFE